MGALLITLFALSFVIPSLAAWTSEIRIFILVGMVLYAAYTYWTQRKDADDLSAKASEASKWRAEAERLRSSLNQIHKELAEANEAAVMAEAAKKKAYSELKKAEQALAECKQLAQKGS